MEDIIKLLLRKCGGSSWSTTTITSTYIILLHATGETFINPITTDRTERTFRGIIQDVVSYNQASEWLQMRLDELD